MMSEITLTGLETHYYFRKQDSFNVSHANFKAVNKNKSSKQVLITICEFVENGNSKEVKDFFIYTDQREIKNPIVLQPDEELVFRITFPFHQINPLESKSYTLIVHAKSGSKEIRAAADIVCFLESG